MALSFKGRVTVQTTGGEFALVGIEGKLGLVIPTWQALWRLARDRSGRTALALLAVIPEIQQLPLPVFIRERQLLVAKVRMTDDQGKKKAALSFRLTPLSFFKKRFPN